MLLEDLVRTIERLKYNAQTYQSRLSQSEALTRYVLIDPLLRALGWDTENPELVQPEYKVGNQKVDYALFKDGQAHVLLEAKPLNTPLGETLTQVINYGISGGVPFYAITDGACWELYDTDQPPAKMKLIQWSLLQDPVEEVTRKALALWYRAPIGTAAPVPVMHLPTSDRLASSAAIAPAFPLASHAIGTQPAQSGTALASLVVKSGERPPGKLIDPNNVDHLVKSWRNVLILVTEWLVQQGLLTSRDCPITLPSASSRDLIAATPRHRSGDDFFSPDQVQGLWLETHASARQLVRTANYLVERFAKGAVFRVVP